MSLTEFGVIGSLLLGIASFLVAMANRRDAVSESTLAPLRTEAERATVTSAQAMAHATQLRADMKDLENRMLRELQSYPMKADLERSLDERFDPILRHIIKTETFMEEVLRSGAFTRRAGQ